jgi:hypothetical protein
MLPAVWRLYDVHIPIQLGSEQRLKIAGGKEARSSSRLWSSRFETDVVTPTSKDRGSTGSNAGTSTPLTDSREVESSRSLIGPAMAKPTARARERMKLETRMLMMIDGMASGELLSKRLGGLENAGGHLYSFREVKKKLVE